MDALIYNGSATLNYCSKENYKAGYCTKLQQDDYEKFFYYKKIIDGIPNKLAYRVESNNTVNVYFLRGFSLQLFWCGIGKYDMKILISYSVFILLFIIFLIVDLNMNKNLDEIGIKYYITTFFYMIFYVVLIIYAVLYLLLLIYSTVVFFQNPNTCIKNYFYTKIYNENHINNKDYSDNSYNSDNSDNSKTYFFKRSINEDEATGLWKEKRLYALIYCAINLLLVIFGFIISILYKIIYSYLSLKFINENNNNNNLTEIKKKERIKVGNKNYDIEIYPFQNLFLSDNETNKIYEFRKILYNKELYYLKVTNKGLKDQVGWTEYQYYPKINEGFSRLLFMFKFS